MTLTTSSASAAEVHFDPDSPAGKEYALPLTQAREEGSGSDGPGIRRGGDSEEAGSTGTSEGAVALFGVGVGGGPGSSRGGSGDFPPDRDAGPTGPTGDSTDAQRARAALVRSAEAGNGYPFASGALLVAGVVLVGAALGIGLRSLQRTTAH